MDFEEDRKRAMAKLDREIEIAESADFRELMTQAFEAEGWGQEEARRATNSHLSAMKTIRAQLEMGWETFPIEHEREGRKTALFELIVPYMKQGHKTWKEIVDAMSDADAERFVELLGDATIEEFFA